MSTKTTTEDKITKDTALSETVENTSETVKPARVERYIPKGSANDDPNMFIGINGVNYILPKGKTSMVPPEVAAEIDRALNAQQKQDDHVDEMLDKSKQ